MIALANGVVGQQYTVAQVETDDEELNDFLFTLGCYKGEQLVIVSIVGESYVVAIRDSRYNMDHNLATAIYVNEG